MPLCRTFCGYNKIIEIGSTAFLWVLDFSPPFLLWPSWGIFSWDHRSYMMAFQTVFFICQFTSGNWRSYLLYLSPCDFFPFGLGWDMGNGACFCTSTWTALPLYSVHIKIHIFPLAGTYSALSQFFRGWVIPFIINCTIYCSDAILPCRKASH